MAVAVVLPANCAKRLLLKRYNQHMTAPVLISILLALAMIGTSLAALANTRVFAGVARYFDRPSGVWIAAGIRLFAAAMLWLAAPVTQHPVVLKVMAAVALAAAIAVVLMGYPRMQLMIRWAVDRPPAVLRLFAVVAIAIGALLLWALLG